MKHALKWYMAFKSSMVKVAKAFDRLLTILCAAHFFLLVVWGGFVPINEQIEASICSFIGANKVCRFWTVMVVRKRHF